jgi:predicted flap endonuclease-1-like 5' DNA nuclease
MARIVKLDGVGEDAARLLREAGIASASDLLKRGATRKDMQHIAQQVGVSEKLILRWVNRAGLLRIQGISSEYADLLEAAGVNSAADLARRNPGNLLQKLVEANTSHNLVPQVPTLSQVADWIEQAQALPGRSGKAKKITVKRQITGETAGGKGGSVITGGNKSHRDYIRGIEIDEMDLDEPESSRGLPGGGGTDNLP